MPPHSIIHFDSKGTAPPPNNEALCGSIIHGSFARVTQDATLENCPKCRAHPLYKSLGGLREVVTS